MLAGRFPRIRPIWAAAAVLAVLALGVSAVALRSSSAAEPGVVAFSQFLASVEAGRVRHVIAEGDRLVFDLSDGTALATLAPAGYVAASPTFVPDLSRRGIGLTVVPAGAARGGGYGAIAISLGLLGLVGLALFRVVTGRVPMLEPSRAVDPQQVTVTFKDVAGVDEAKDEVVEIVEFLRHPSKFGAIGGRIPRGVLLVGPPGTGKTLLARSMAGEARVPFLCASGSDFVEMYAGVGAARVRRLFKEARRHAACIVFIDELDAVGRNRGGQSLSHEEREQTLNQLLVEMDGFARSDGIVVVAATNRADILDSALLRPGRFDRQVVVGHPDLRGREQILRVHTRAVALQRDVELRAVARGTPGFSGADLANLVNEAALLAARSGRTAVGARDLEAARDKVLMGAERKSVAMSEGERAACAYHEAGHAVVAARLPGADPLHKVTIVPRGRALGVTMQLPEGERHTHAQSYLEGRLAILMGGRVAEELFLRQATSGAADDIERATALARRMVCELGMSALGPVCYAGAGGAPEGESGGAGLSEETARRVDEAIRAAVLRGHETAREVLEREREGVEALARELLQHESADAARVAEILSRRT